VGITTRHAVLIAGLLAAAVAAPSLRNDFVGDDQWIIAQRPFLRHPGSIGAVLAESYWPASFGGSLWRPAVLASYALDYRISSSPHWFHAMNVLWAALATALLTLLACEMGGPLVGLITGSLFAVHPVHVEAIANVVGRAELMAAAGYAAALVCALRGQGRPAYLAGVGLGAAFAIASKELAATLPAAVVLVYAARRLPIRAALPSIAVAAVPIVAYYILHTLIGAGNLSAGGTAPGLEHLGLLSRSWAMLPLTLEWWRLMLFPWHLSADYSPGDVLVSTGVTPAHIVALLVWAGAVWAAWHRHRTIPGLAIGLAWMVITVSPVANVVVPTELLVAERTLYLPSFGMLFALGSVAVALRWTPRVRAAVVAATVALFVARSVARIPSWHDDEAHYQALRREAPRSYRTLWLEGKDEFAAGRWGSGERMLLQSIAFAPSVTGPRYDLARFYMRSSLWQPAIRQLQAALAVDSAFTPARDALREAQAAAARVP
jgi:protein O-mannosyl-transferase